MEGDTENSPQTRRLAYAESQEPDEMSQIDALNAVDRFLSFQEEQEKENRYGGILHGNSTGVVAETNSELNLSAKVVTYLSHQHSDKHLIRKMDVFDWVDTSVEERENCNNYNVGPATQMAAEVLEELFNEPPPMSPAHPSKIEEINLDTETKETETEHCIFKHPKRRRTMVKRTPRQSVVGDLDGCSTDRLPLIMDSVKRKKRSPFVRRYASKHRNLRSCPGVRCQQNEMIGTLLNRTAGDSDSGKIYLIESSRTHGLALRVDGIRKFSNERKNRSRIHAIRVIFSQNLNPKVVRQQKKFGSSTVLSMSDATHFVADRFARTKNMMEAIAMGRNVVRHDWLESCAKAGCLVSEENFVLRDLEKEREIGFSMSDSIQWAKRFPLLEALRIAFMLLCAFNQGWRVYITPKARPNKELLRCLVKASRGQLVERLSRYTMEHEDYFKGNFFIISCEEDYQICLPLLNIGIKAYDSELLLNGIVIQKLEFERHHLFAGKS